MAESRSEALPRKSRWTLARRLSLLFVGLLALVITVFGTAAYRDVRDATIERTTERLTNVARELAAGSARTSTARGAALLDLSRNDIVRQVVAQRAPDEALDQPARVVAAGADVTVGTSPALRATLDSLLAQRYPPTDTTMVGSQLLDATGRRRFGRVVHGSD
ncbi:MAG TPA: hypothetical protein VE861_03025, partial [Gemmatimonadaceae bacterium]|nr:hypothetical protein [Gemmatimonadaceae bacterium]